MDEETIQLMILYAPIIKTIAYALISISSIFAIIQFYLLRKWNKQQLTIVEIRHSYDNIKNCIKYLNDHINYQEEKRIISVEDMHKYMGNFINEKEYNYLDEKDKKMVVKEYGKFFLFNATGKELKENISCLLNNLEYICAGINQNTFDNKTAKRIMATILVYAVGFFKDYIEHLKIDHKWGDKVYCEIIDIENKWKD